MAIDREEHAEPTSGGRAIEVWSLVLRHLLLIVFTSAVGVGLGYLYFLRQPPVYQSSSSLLVRMESKNQVNPFQGAFQGVDSSTQRDQPHALLMASPLIVGEAINKELGAGLGSDTGPRRLRDLPSFAGMENPTRYIISRLSVRPAMQNGLESSDVVNLTYRSTDALTSKAVLEKVVESYCEFLGDSHKNVSKEVLELIRQAKDSLLEQMGEVETKYAQFREDTPLLFHGDAQAVNVHKERLAEIEMSRAKLIILLTERRAELQSVTEALARGGSREAISLMIQSMKPDTRGADAGVKSVASEVFPLLLEEQLLLETLGPEHPKVKQIQKRIALTESFHLNEMADDERPLRSRRTDFLTVYIDAIRHEIRSLDSKVKELDELFENERFEAKSLAVFEVKNENLTKELKRTEQLYQGVVKRLDEINLMQDYGGYKTAVISPASIGVHVAPVLSQTLLLGAAFGAAVGFALAYLAEANDKTFRSPEEVSEHLGLPIVGHIPVIQGDAIETRSDSKLDRTLVTFYKPKSRLSESYRAIRTSLYFSTRGEQHKVIQITSPNPGDGKTTLSANLAVSIAQSGKRVLLIDADFRRPRIHDLFGLNKSVGMSSVISGETELPDAIQATEVENLWAMPCGPRPNNPCELLTSRRFEELLEILREQYDFVIIDTPPLLAVTDPSAVAARVDGVLLTLRLSKRTRGEATKAAELLATLGGNTLGVVVNGIGRTPGYGYGYGYGYGGYGGYGSYGGYQYRYSEKYGSASENPYYADDGADADKPTESKPRRRSSVARRDA